MGPTEKTEQELMDYIYQELEEKYSPSTYELRMCNCNSFAEELFIFLVNQPLPQFMVKVVEETKNVWMAWVASKFSSLGSGSNQGSYHGSQSRNNNCTLNVNLPCAGVPGMSLPLTK